MFIGLVQDDAKAINTWFIQNVEFVITFIFYLSFFLKTYIRKQGFADNRLLLCCASITIIIIIDDIEELQQLPFVRNLQSNNSTFFTNIFHFVSVYFLLSFSLLDRHKFEQISSVQFPPSNVSFSSDHTKNIFVLYVR